MGLLSIADQIIDHDLEYQEKYLETIGRKATRDCEPGIVYQLAEKQPKRFLQR